MGFSFTKSWHFLDLSATLECDNLVQLVYLRTHIKDGVVCIHLPEEVSWKVRTHTACERKIFLWPRMEI